MNRNILTRYQQYAVVTLSVILSLAFVWAVVFAANTTIGNNISTSGSLTVGSFSLFSGAISASSTLQVTGDLTLYGGFTSTGIATSTFANGLNLSNGCFAVNGVCVGGGGGAVPPTQSNETANRVIGINYQNTGQAAILVAVVVDTDGGAEAYSDDAPVPITQVGSSHMPNNNTTLTFLVIPGNYYRVTSSGVMVSWIEWTVGGVRGEQGAPGGGDSGLFYARDEKPSGTSGGLAVTNGYQTRDLNTLVSNSISGASLASNQITLPSGTYRVSASCPATWVNTHRIRIQNMTDNAPDGVTLLLGSNAYSIRNNIYDQTDSLITGGRFTINAAKTLELQHYTKNGHATDDELLGVKMDIVNEVEVYCQISISKE